MMSASLLITSGSGEQTKMRPVSDDLLSDQGEPEGVSFAKTFNERVGVASLEQGENTTGEAAIALPGLKSITLAKKLDEVAGVPNGVKGKAASVQQRSAHGELKNVNGAKIIPPQATTGTGSEEKTTAIDSAMKAVVWPTQAEEIAYDLSSSSSVPYAKPADGATHEGSVPQDSIADGDHPHRLVSRGSDSTVLKAIRTAETDKEDVSTKKIAKTQEGEAAPKTVQETVGAVAPTIALEAKPMVGSSSEGGVNVAAQTIAPQSDQKEISKPTEVFDKGVSAVSRASTAVSPATVDGLVRKDPAASVKSAVTDTQTTATAGNDLVPSPKTAVSPEKATAIPIPGGSDGENKPKSAPDTSTALLHSMGIEPTAVTPGNPPGELGAIKLPVGDASAHTTGLPMGAREQDGPGVVAQSMDGAPRMLTATPTSLEVGIQNGTHGWLRVRAEMTEGVVNASVAATSSAGQEMLHRELPALTAYLLEEKVGVNAVVVHAATSAGTDARGSSGMDGAGGGTPQRNGEGDAQQSLRKATLDDFGETMIYRRPDGIEEDGTLPLAAYARGGSWLSVRA
jgi:hypothetical protein